MLLAVVAACAGETVEVPGETVVVEKVVTETVEVPGETVVVEKEVIKTVEVPGETVTKEVVKEVMVPGETVVVKEEVVKTVEVPGQTVVKEVVKTVEVPGQTVVVEKEVVKTVEVPGQTVVVTKEVLKVVEVRQGYVTDPTTGKAVSAPQYGGTFTYATKSEPPHGDPNSAHSAGLAIAGVAEKLAIPNWAVDRDVYSFSTQFIPTEFFVGQLAESWEQPDPLTYIFHIRKGVRWHNKAPMNGRELTAKDVEYTWHRLLGLGSGFTEPSTTGSCCLLPLGFESITATDNSTVVFKLKEPNAVALHMLMAEHLAFIMPPEAIEQYGDLQDWRNLVGTGPYEITDWVQGTSLTHTKVPDYRGFDEKYPQNRLPYIDKLVGLFIKEEATYIAGLRAGRIDYLGFTGGVSDITSVDQIDSLRRTNPEIELLPWWGRAETAYGLDSTKPPFDDIRVRRAMQMALDLKTINATFFKGTARSTPQGITGEGMKGYYTPFDDWPEEVKKGYTYDPEGAKMLLAEAGYPDGFETLLTHAQEGDLGYTELVAEYWKAIGIDAEIRVLDRPQWTPLVESGKMEGIFTTVQGMNHPWGALGQLRFQAHSASVWNLSKIKDAEIDAKIEAAEATTDIAEQQRLAREVDDFFIEQQFYVWGPQAGKYMAIQPWVIGYNGEVHFAAQHRLVIFARVWIDQELKKAMGH